MWNQLDLIPLLSFVFITTYTPGPNNLTAASMGVLHGYRRALPYLLGIMTGFAGIMALAGIVSSTLLSVFPPIQTIMRYVGALYILWLAWHTFRASYQLEVEEELQPLGYTQGLMLQLFNPKVIVFALTLYTSFLAPLAGHVLNTLISGILLACVAFSAISTWTLFGAAIRRYLERPRVQRAINAALALLLAYSAVELSGVLKY
jgi:cysteine/O-acetylserine efflux protein